MPATLPMVLGLAGTTLSRDEIDFFRHHPPLGFILFDRNIENHQQLRRLTDSLQNLVTDCFIFIDQEGGRVRRLKPPMVLPAPPMAEFFQCHQTITKNNLPTDDLLATIKRHAHVQSSELRALGINGNMVPVLDIKFADAHDIIGDRALGDNPATIIALATPYLEGLVEQAILPVMKHIPGHGRARVDSHLALPTTDAPKEILQKTDFAPFRHFAKNISTAIPDPVPLAMTAHMVYQAIDPRPATTSPIVVNDIIRGDIGFHGLIMTDDLSMKALMGSVFDNAALSLQAGCDIMLHCNGKMDEMTMVVEAINHHAGPIKNALSNLTNLYRKWLGDAMPALSPDQQKETHQTINQFLTRYR